ncbi:MAG: UvrD-helicase domain-containing protein, partial [Acidimicrobiales bacterium]
MISGDPLLDDLTDEQHDAVTTRASPLCIIAGAGSGKTRVLTRRIAWQAQQGHIDPRRVLALTFTRRAAHELRGRLRRLGLRDAVAAGTFHAV